LNLQDQYSQNVDKNAYRIVDDTSKSFQRGQRELFRMMNNDLQEAVKKATKEMDIAQTNCKAAATATQEATEKLYKFQTWKDYLYYAAPAAVLLNLIFRAVQQFFL
jgi:hypothetical protein